MNEHFTPPGSDKSAVARIVAAAALALLALTNLAWLMAYNSLSQRVVGVASPGPSTSVSSTPKLSTSPIPTPTPPTTGDITGTLSYPAEQMPAQTVCAVSTTDGTKKYCVDHAAGTSSTYVISAPVGTYNVYASVKTTQGDFTPSYKAYYNKFVTCGMTSSCPASGHTQLNPVKVTAGMTTDGVNPTDWYASS